MSVRRRRRFPVCEYSFRPDVSISRQEAENAYWYVRSYKLRDVRTPIYVTEEEHLLLERSMLVLRVAKARLKKLKRASSLV